VTLVASMCVGVAYSIECATGYGQQVRVIPEKWINDGFCDCPLDALDEPKTEACSGAPVGGWAGVNGRMDSRYVLGSPWYSISYRTLEFSPE
jgi:hypothetical protein